MVREACVCASEMLTGHNIRATSMKWRFQMYTGEERVCPECGGDGEVFVDDDQYGHYETCSTCGGSGYIDD